MPPQTPAAPSPQAGAGSAAPLAPLSAAERAFLERAAATHADCFSEVEAAVEWSEQGLTRTHLSGRAERTLGDDGRESLEASSPHGSGLEPFSADDLAALEGEIGALRAAAGERRLRPLRIRVSRRRVRVALRWGAAEREERLVEVVTYGPGRWRRSALGVNGLPADLAEEPWLELATEPCPTLAAPAWLGPQACGVVLHELIGHGRECGPAGEAPVLAAGSALGSEELTVLDAPGHGAPGSPPGRDDEGQPAPAVVLVEGGVVRGALGDLRSARLGCAGPGHGRRSSFRDPPLPRMTNLLVRPGRIDGRRLRDAVSVAVPRIASGSVSLDGGRARLRAPEIHVDGRRYGDAWVVVDLAALRHAQLADRAGPGIAAWCSREGQTVPVSTSAPAMVVAVRIEPA